jgi:hypothetical protein
MFQQACVLYRSVYCVVVGQSTSAANPVAGGVGCFVAPGVVLTADHIYEECQRSGDTLTALCAQGMLELAPVWRHEEADVALFRVVRGLRGSGSNSAQPGKFPRIGRGIAYGMSIGYLARLRRNDEDGERESHLAFFEGSASIYFSKGEFASKWMLSGGFVESGFSGGPAFSVDGDLVGVVVGSVQFPAQDHHPLTNVFCAPVVTPIAGIERYIAEATSSVATER